MRFHRRRLLVAGIAASAVTVWASCNGGLGTGKSTDPNVIESARASDDRGPLAPTSPPQSLSKPPSAQSATPSGNVDSSEILAQVHSRCLDGGWGVFRGVEFGFSFNHQIEKDAVIKQVSRLRDLTEVCVHPVFYSSSRYFDRISDESDQWAAPDIYTGGADWIPRMGSRDQVLEIDEYVRHWIDWEDFYSSAQEDVAFDGHVLGVPFRASHRGTPVIRRSLFRKAGLPPHVPSSWDELNEVTKRLTIKDGENFIQSGINLEHDAQVYEDWLLQAGGRVLNEWGTTPLINTSFGRMALKQHVRHGLHDGTMPLNGTLAASGLFTATGN